MILILNIVFLALLLPASPAFGAPADDPNDDLPEVGLGAAREPPAIPEITIIGSKRGVGALTGSGYYVDAAEIRQQGYADINRILRRAPGVYLREEDGYGLFPNISMRGVSSQRSSKISVMEDGILTAPAPYSAPAAYYMPAAGRMSAIEVLKGSSQIQFGPQTTGGAINYRSTPIGEGFHGHLSVHYGSDNEFRQFTYLSNTWNTELGNFGLLAEYYFRHTDGFKRIDATESISSSGDTGFRKGEPMFKFFFEPRGDRYQRIEGKIGWTDLDGDETYMGLTDRDFDANSKRRYSASRFDNIDTNQMRSYLRYTTELPGDATLTTTGYYHTFRRNWFKERGDGRTLARNVANGCWTGTAACELRYRNNRRKYYAAGAESVLDVAGEIGRTEHEIRFGARLHQDRAKRSQDDYTYLQDDQGAITGGFSNGRCTGGCRTQKSRALALFVQDRIRIGSLTLQPGLRFEHIRFSYDQALEDGSDTLTYWAPGIGALWQAREDLELYAGLYRGVSPPGPRAHVRGGVREETSLGAELGLRFSPSAFFRTEVAGFYTDFDDLLVLENIGSGGSSADENVGDVIAYGLELSADFDPALWLGYGFANPWHLALTLTRAELSGDAESSDVESIFAGGVDGNDVPYIPSYQVSLGTGIELDRLSLFVDATWVDETYSTASNVSAPINPATGEVDFNFGETDAYFFVDASAHYRVSERTRLTLNLHNVFDAEYIVSRHPIGPRPGAPRSLLVGVEYDW